MRRRRREGGREGLWRENKRSNRGLTAAAAAAAAAATTWGDGSSVSSPMPKRKLLLTHSLSPFGASNVHTADASWNGKGPSLDGAVGIGGSGTSDRRHCR